VPLTFTLTAPVNPPTIGTLALADNVGPSATALVSTGYKLVVIGLALLWWHAFRTRDAHRMYWWLGATLSLPFVTMITMGFIGYGASATLTVLIFASTTLASTMLLVSTALVAKSTLATDPFTILEESTELTARSAATIVPSAIKAEVIALTAISAVAIVPSTILEESTELTAKSAATIVPSAILAEVTALSARSAVTIVPSAMSAEVIALTAMSTVAIVPSAIFAELMALFAIVAIEAPGPVAVTSPVSDVIEDVDGLVEQAQRELALSQPRMSPFEQAAPFGAYVKY